MSKEEKKEMTLYDLPGVGAATAEKLSEAGFGDLMALAVASPGELVEVAGVGEGVAKRIINVSRNNLDMGFETGEDLLKKREQVQKITSGSKMFDTLIGGGFETGSISECYGPFGSGKSALAHYLAVSTQLPKEKGGVGGAVVWIDTESTFRPERIVQIADSMGIDSKKCLRNIRCVRAYNSDHQMLVAEKVEDLIKEGLPVKLVIVDSLMAHFRAEFAGRGTLAERQQKINKHMHTLMKLADVNKLCVYVTNQVMSKPDTFFGDPTAAIGGNIVGHNCLLEGTLIQLPNGRIRPIERIMEENEVLSVDLGNSLKSRRTKIQTVVAKRKDKAYNIQTTHRISASGEHRFFTVDNFQIKEIRAKELRSGDYIAHGCNFEVESRVQWLPILPIRQLMAITSRGRELILSSCDSNRLELCSSLNITPRQFRRVLNQGYPTDESNIYLLREKGISLEFGKYVKEHFTGKHKKQHMPEKLNEDLAQILGYFLGDGHLEERAIRFKDERYEVLDYYRGLFSKLTGVSGSIKKVANKNCYQLEINSKALVKLFSFLKQDLFDYIGGSPDSCVASFIKGFFDADGSVDAKAGAISASQKDDRTIQIIQMYLDRLGIRSRLRKYKHYGNWINQLDIRDNRAILLFANTIGFTASDKQGRAMEKVSRMKFNQLMTPIRREELKSLIKDFGISPSRILRSRSVAYVGQEELERVISILKDYKPLNNKAQERLDFLISLVNSDLKWEKVSKISVEDTDKLFYDFGAQGMENYLANGFLTHNSQTRVYLRRGKAGTRVAKLVDSPHLPDGEAIFKITDNGIEDAK